MVPEKTLFRVAGRRVPFAQLANAMLRDTRLSLDARGALAFILSHPDDWSFSVAWFMRANKIGRDKTDRIIKELVSAGYCARRQNRGGRGRFSPFEYWFSDNPEALKDTVEPEAPSDDPEAPTAPPPTEPATASGFSGCGEPVTGQPDAVNHHTTNTVLPNTVNEPVPLKRARAARSEAGQGLEGLKGEGSTGAQLVDKRSISRAEGLGLDVVPILAKASSQGVRQPRAIFLVLVHQQLTEILPGLTRDVIVAGLTGPDAAYQELLTLVSAATLK